MNNNANKLSSEFYYPLEREKLAISAVEYLIKYPEIYKQVQDGWGNAGMSDIIREGEKLNEKKTNS